MKEYNIPFQVGWDLVTKCNLRCKHCFYTDEQLSDNRWFSKEEAVKFINYLVKKKIFVLSLAGGEPLLYPYLKDIISIATKNKIIVTLATNAINLNKKMAEDLWNAGLRSMQISLEGSCPTINDSIRGNGTFKQILKGIRIAIDQGFQVLIASVILKNNYKDIENIIRLGVNEGAQGIKIQTFIEGGLGESNIQDIGLDLFELKKTIKHLWKIKPKWDGKFNIMLPLIPEVIEESKKSPEYFYKDSSCLGCQPGLTTINVDPYGDLRSCGNPAEDENILGNVIETPLQEIWQNSSELIQIRNKSRVSQGKTSTACGTICGNGCRATMRS